jgi:hypothetical protein
MASKGLSNKGIGDAGTFVQTGFGSIIQLNVAHTAGGNPQVKQDIALSASGNRNKSIIEGSSRGFKAAPSTVKKAECPAVAQQAQRGKHRVDSYEVAPQTRKLPPSSLDVEQRIANAGEALPIVFGKRQSFFGGLLTIGGTWVAPSLIRSYCYPKFDNPNLSAGNVFTNDVGEFKFIYVYALSQGLTVSTPTVFDTFVGGKSIKSIQDVGTITINKEYKDASFIAANPTFCPLSAEGTSCNNDIITWFVGPLTSDYTDIYARGENQVAFGVNVEIKATGPMQNTGIEMGVELIDVKTGNIILMANGDPFIILASYIFPREARWVSRRNTEVFWTNFTANGQGNSGAYMARYKLNFIDYQFVSSRPADTNTITSIKLAGTQGPNYTYDVPPVQTAGYADITILSMEANITEGEPKPKQAYFFIDQGIAVTLYSQGASGGNYAIGASNKFVDLGFYLFTQYKAIAPTSDALYQSIIDDTDAALVSRFHEQYFMLCNGVIDVSVNIIDYITEAANYFLTAFINVDGKYRFAPLLPLTSSGFINTGAITPKVAFTESNILGGSYSKQYIPPYDRTEFVASIVYREVSNKVVSKQQTVEIYYPGTSLDAPREQYDLTDFCVDIFHAAIFAAYQLAKRKYVTHSVRFETFLPNTKLIPTDIISVTMDRRTTAGDDRTETNYYQVTGVTFAQDGRVAIDAIEFPLDSNGESPICADVDNLSFEVIG